MYQISDGWMVFNDEFNEPLSSIVFTSGIQQIKFGDNFNQDINNLPNSIIYLTFGWYFDQDVSKLPNRLAHLTFTGCFDQEMHNLPNSLTHLTFSWDFNQDVSNLPNSLTHLIFGYEFNQDVSQLPKSITCLKFSEWSYSRFNHNLNPYLYHLTEVNVKYTHKQKRLMLERCQINKHNSGIRKDKLIDLLLKN